MNDERAIEFGEGDARNARGGAGGAGGAGERHYKMRGKWVTIRSFPSAEQAHLLKLQLDRAGIPCFIDNENTGTTLWYAQPAVGGIRLRVPAPFEQQAKEVLESGSQVEEDDDDEEGEEWKNGLPDESDEDEEDEPDEADEEEYGEASGDSCPACHTEDITPFTWGRRIGQAALVLCLGVGLDIIHPLLLGAALVGAIYLLLTKPDYRCLRCGKRWVVGRDVREA